MSKVEECLDRDGVELKGSMPDILTYLEQEQKRCGNVKLSEYIRRRRLERILSEQLGVADVREGFGK